MEYITRNVPREHPAFGKAFPCPRCKVPQLEAKKAQDDQERIFNAIKDSGISPRHAFDFDDFFALSEELRAGKEEAAQACFELATWGYVDRNDIRKYGVMLFGKYGKGKTTLGTAFCIEAARRGKSIMRIKTLDFIGAVQDAYNAKGDEASSEDLIRMAQQVDCLLLDDFGVPERDGFKDTIDKVRILHRVLEARVENNKPTCLTSNLESHEEIEQQFTKRTAERVRELCHRIEVAGSVLRQ